MATEIKNDAIYRTKTPKDSNHWHKDAVLIYGYIYDQVVYRCNTGTDCVVAYCRYAYRYCDGISVGVAQTVNMGSIGNYLY